jgi:hypothetical protein
MSQRLNLPVGIYDTNFETKLLELMKILSVKENKFIFVSYDSIVNFIGEKFYGITNPEEHYTWSGYKDRGLSDDPWMYLDDGALFQIDIGMLQEDLVLDYGYVIELEFRNNNCVEIKEYNNECGDQFSARMKKFLIDRIDLDLDSKKSKTWADAIDILMKLKEIRDENLFSYKIMFEIPEIKK